MKFFGILGTRRETRRTRRRGSDAPEHPSCRTAIGCSRRNATDYTIHTCGSAQFSRQMRDRPVAWQVERAACPGYRRQRPRGRSAPTWPDQCHGASRALHPAACVARDAGISLPWRSPGPGQGAPALGCSPPSPPAWRAAPASGRLAYPLSVRVFTAAGATRPRPLAVLIAGGAIPVASLVPGGWLEREPLVGIGPALTDGQVPGSLWPRAAQRSFPGAFPRVFRQEATGKARQGTSITDRRRQARCGLRHHLDTSRVAQTWKLSPQPQRPFSFGFVKVNPAESAFRS